MKNTEFSLENICSFISAGQTMENVLDFMKEFDLEVKDVSF